MMQDNEAFPGLLPRVTGLSRPAQTFAVGLAAGHPAKIKERCTVFVSQDEGSGHELRGIGQALETGKARRWILLKPPEETQSC